MLQNQLRAKEAQPDPLASKPQLEAQRVAALEAHYATQMELMRLMAGQWEGVVERGAAELALREAEMQVRGVQGV